ncbi:MAG: thioredoxin domain-containing protein [Pseudomonadota bacterium]
MRAILLLFLLLGTAPLWAASPLQNHPSAYLAQHADDPVRWRTWSESVWQLAQSEGKPLFISSGYFACHWCHVMQRESFRDEAIARQLNRHFIPVKIDRELRPDVDAALFEIVEQQQGVAGWPLNVFLTPRGEPLAAVVYQPAPRFAATVEAVRRQWEGFRPGKPPADKGRPAGAEMAVSALRERLEAALLEALARQGDYLSGGFGDGSKFPRVPLLTLLLEHYRDDPDVAELLQLTLEQIRTQGLRDHLGGGFFRYTVDPQWREPHFEKMLYDNAQLARLYLRAAERLDEPRYRRLGEQTLDFMLRNLWHPRGALVGSLSALDSEGREGGYYLWRREELAELLDEQALSLLNEAWSLDSAPALEHGFVPLIEGGRSNERLRAIHQRLLRQRSERTAVRDNKRLAGWNGLALSALSLGAGQRPRYRIAASAVADYLHGLWEDGRLWMMRDEGGTLRQHASLEDYALTAAGLAAWHRRSGDERSRELAIALTRKAVALFYRDGLWRLGSGADLRPLERRYRAVAAGPLPSPVVELLRLQRQLGLKLLPGEAVLMADPDTLLANPLDYPGYLALLNEGVE